MPHEIAEAGKHYRTSAPGPKSYALSACVIAACTALGLGMQTLLPRFEDINVVLILLLGVVFVATGMGRGPAILASILSVLSFHIIFIAPAFSPLVAEVESMITLLVMLIVTIVLSGLAGRVREQAEIARDGERRAITLYQMSRDLSRVRGVDNLSQVCVNHVSNVFDCAVEVCLTDASGKLSAIARARNPEIELDKDEAHAAAQWVFETRPLVGSFNLASRRSAALLVPLIASRGLVGLLSVFLKSSSQPLDPVQLRLLETLASQTALALERAQLVDETQKANIAIETERLRNTLLSSISHDLRTPLAAITGSASSLLEDEDLLDSCSRRDLAQAIFEESNLLNRLVGELLDMTRLESGTVKPNYEWQPLEEPVGTALRRLESALKGRPLRIDLPSDLPLVRIDGALIAQVLFNLLDNALKYAPGDTVVEISARMQSKELLLVEVSDRGSGLPERQEERIFDKFYRARHAGGGVGLGLSICRSIIETHGGQIWAKNREGGGAVFSFTLPQKEEPPAIGASMTVAAEED